MILLFGFISKKIYDCIGARGEDAPAEATTGEKAGEKDGEKTSGDQQKSATESGDKVKSGPASGSRVEDVRSGATPQEKSGSATSKGKFDL